MFLRRRLWRHFGVFLGRFCRHFRKMVMVFRRRRRGSDRFFRLFRFFRHFFLLFLVLLTAVPRLFSRRRRHHQRRLFLLHRLARLFFRRQLFLLFLLLRRVLMMMLLALQIRGQSLRRFLFHLLLQLFALLLQRFHRRRVHERREHRFRGFENGCVFFLVIVL